MELKHLALLTAPFIMVNVPVVYAAQLTYNVTAFFYEPDTQPNNTIFTGTFVYDTTTQAISGLKGTLSESMTGDGVDPATQTLVPLNYQLSSVSDGQGGQLVSAFALSTTNVFQGGGFATGGMKYFGYPSAWNAATANAYVTINVNLSNPLIPLTGIQLNRLAYGDCTAEGMMGNTCMTGNAAGGTMGATPFSQTIALRH
ncbi:MAG: PEP-CTERM sorting domain-containing protein [Proteobacteria bacterium]|nr:PEP-CTERM sorting domain-containing protein [Pseudomonadota bacterium]